jgi:hypothetical protein
MFCIFVGAIKSVSSLLYCTVVNLSAVSACAIRGFVNLT